MECVCQQSPFSLNCNIFFYIIICSFNIHLEFGNLHKYSENAQKIKMKKKNSMENMSLNTKHQVVYACLYIYTLGLHKNNIKCCFTLYCISPFEAIQKEKFIKLFFFFRIVGSKKKKLIFQFGFWFFVFPLSVIIEKQYDKIKHTLPGFSCYLIKIMHIAQNGKFNVFCMAFQKQRRKNYGEPFL